MEYKAERRDTDAVVIRACTDHGGDVPSFSALRGPATIELPPFIVSEEESKTVCDLRPIFDDEASIQTVDKEASLHTVKYHSSFEGDLEIDRGDDIDELEQAYRCCSTVKLAQTLCLLLCGIVWFSMLAFGLFIAYQYLGVGVLGGNMESWNDVLNNLYDREDPAGNAMMGTHLVGGMIVCFAGCIQLVGSVRRSIPMVHRVVGYVYLTSCTLAAAGGLAFIIRRGCVGGRPMDAGFGLYGVCVLYCAAHTLFCARSSDYATHRQYALRLFALAIGSWLFRLENGFLHLVMNDYGHTGEFRGWADFAMDYFFFVPNLVVVELYLWYTKDKEVIVRGQYAELDTQKEALAKGNVNESSPKSTSANQWMPKTHKGRVGAIVSLLFVIIAVCVGTFSFVGVLDE